MLRTPATTAAKHMRRFISAGGFSRFAGEPLSQALVF
jgi:hypothetical protein